MRRNRHGSHGSDRLGVECMLLAAAKPDENACGLGGSRTFYWPGVAGGDWPSPAGQRQAWYQALLAVHGQPGGRDQRRHERRDRSVAERQTLAAQTPRGSAGLGGSAELSHAGAGSGDAGPCRAALVGQLPRVATGQEPKQPGRRTAATAEVAAAGKGPRDSFGGPRLWPHGDGPLVPGTEVPLHHPDQARRVGSLPGFSGQIVPLSGEKREVPRAEVHAVSAQKSGRAAGDRAVEKGTAQAARRMLVLNERSAAIGLA